MSRVEFSEITKHAKLRKAEEGLFWDAIAEEGMTSSDAAGHQFVRGAYARTAREMAYRVRDLLRHKKALPPGFEVERDLIRAVRGALRGDYTANFAYCLSDEYLKKSAAERAQHNWETAFARLIPSPQELSVLEEARKEAEAVETKTPAPKTNRNPLAPVPLCDLVNSLGLKVTSASVQAAYAALLETGMATNNGPKSHVRIPYDTVSVVEDLLTRIDLLFKVAGDAYPRGSHRASRIPDPETGTLVSVVSMTRKILKAYVDEGAPKTIAEAKSPLAAFLTDEYLTTPRGEKSSGKPQAARVKAPAPCAPAPIAPAPIAPEPATIRVDRDLTKEIREFVASEVRKVPEVEIEPKPCSECATLERRLQEAQGTIEILTQTSKGLADTVEAFKKAARSVCRNLGRLDTNEARWAATVVSAAFEHLMADDRG